MIQLSYHPAFDPGHAIFRTLCIRSALHLDSLEFDKLRILDFYFLFPYRAADIRLKRGDGAIRVAAKRAESRKGYSLLPSDPVLFGRMESAQLAALQTMAAKGAVSAEQLSYGTVQFVDPAITEDLSRRVAEETRDSPEIIEITKELSQYELYGRDGLKARTGLMEFRYDPV